MMKNIIFLAPPASGKGTQAKLLSDKYQMIHISTGDLLREASSRNDEFGTKLKSILRSGGLVSDEIVIELLRQKMESSNDCGLIFDGFPRTVNQAIKLDEILKEIGKKIDHVIYLDVDYDILEKRITGRRICKSCGKIYNIYQENRKLCICGSELYQRDDDNLESFKTRYQTYIQQTQPLIDFYNERNILVSIDASCEIDQIFNQISSIIDGD